MTDNKAGEHALLDSDNEDNGQHPSDQGKETHTTKDVSMSVDATMSMDADEIKSDEGKDVLEDAKSNKKEKVPKEPKKSKKPDAVDTAEESTQPFDQDAWLKHCRELVSEYRNLLQKGKSNYYKKDGDIGYLLSMKWLNEWKKMVYYDSFYRGLHPEFDDERSVKIGEIDNDSLLRDKDSFYTDIDETSYYNYILKPNIKMNVDYKPVDEDTWKFFHSRYGGTPIKRFYYKTYSFGADIEAKLKEFKVVILPNLENWDKDKITEEKSIFTSKHDNFQDLLDRLEEILNSDKYKMKLSQDTMRAWKLSYNGDINKIDKKIRESIEADMDVEDDNATKENNESESKSEKNTGVKFPGTSLEMMKKFEIEDLEISANDTLVIETASEETKKFIFAFEKVEILGYGKCEYCYSHKPLIIQCRCEEVQYCGEECMKKDERFHVDKCNAPIDLGHDGPFEKKDRARNGLTGLQNLGNTCFMSSSIQCLSNTWILTKYFLEEKFKEELNKDNVLGTGGKLTVAFAKLLNEMWNEESPVVTPWSFKKVVGNFQPMFSGFAQHDSAELLSFALDGLHEDLNRIIKKPY